MLPVTHLAAVLLLQFKSIARLDGVETVFIAHLVDRAVKLFQPFSFSIEKRQLRLPSGEVGNLQTDKPDRFEPIPQGFLQQPDRGPENGIIQISALSGRAAAVDGCDCGTRSVSPAYRTLGSTGGDACHRAMSAVATATRCWALVTSKRRL